MIGQSLVTFNRRVALFLLLVATAWVALVNGQPLFNTDTTAYVRGADFAVVYFLGPKFATSWTQERTLQGVEQRQQHEGHDVKHGGIVSLDSPFDKAVMAGRSIYYGALLYLGHIAGQFWLVVLTQAAILLYLSYTLMIKCLRSSFVSFVCVTAITLVATPLSFFISVLMPDVFAGYLILSVVILIEFWNSLQSSDKVILSFIILYSALTHTSHLLLLILMVLFLAIISFLAGRNANSQRPVRNSLAVLLALSLLGILGEMAFSYGVRHTIGVDPIRPPFLMARMIADGPGNKFLQENCAKKAYTVCKYIDRLPVSGGEFLWSTSPTNGVFSVADLPTRRALSSEQTSFAIDVFRFDPVGVIASATRDFFRQFFEITLDSFFLNKEALTGFAAGLPTSYFNAMTRSRIAMRDGLLQILAAFYFSTYVTSLLVLLLVSVSLYWTRSKRKPHILSLSEWGPMLTVVALAIVSNAAICGILSGPASRYQTRVSWIPLFIFGLIAAKYWEARNCKIGSETRLQA
jgi:hypothetical protein